MNINDLVYYNNRHSVKRRYVQYRYAFRFILAHNRRVILEDGNTGRCFHFVEK